MKGVFALLGAAVGIVAGGKKASAAQEPPEEPKQGKRFVLYARGLRISSQDLRRGALPQSGIRMLARAELVNESSPEDKAGDFFASYYRVNTAGKVNDHEAGSLEQHTFILPEGTLFGSGVTTSGLESEGHFAIIGGTGRYQGARGSYVARQSHVDFGGNGTATFTLTLL
jgi:hypothetical protein